MKYVFDESAIYYMLETFREKQFLFYLNDFVRIATIGISYRIKRLEKVLITYLKRRILLIG